MSSSAETCIQHHTTAYLQPSPYNCMLAASTLQLHTCSQHLTTAYLQPAPYNCMLAASTLQLHTCSQHLTTACLQPAPYNCIPAASTLQLHTFQCFFSEGASFSSLNILNYSPAASPMNVVSIIHAVKVRLHDKQIQPVNELMKFV